MLICYLETFKLLAYLVDKISPKNKQKIAKSPTIVSYKQQLKTLEHEESEALKEYHDMVRSPENYGVVFYVYHFSCAKK